ncbi:MAG: ParM/StbA family protein [Candidatus Glassbacteria bacterium]|nr:ParM/StbA family protein [Candidatus Glassbacteria bacterium]
MEYLGVDVGFGYTKAFDGDRSVIFKSIIGDATDIQFHSGFSEGSELENLHVELDGKQFYVGDMAEKQSNVREFTLDQNTLLENSAKILALTSLSLFTGPTVREFSLVTGLPIRYFKQYRAKFQQMLEGSHKLRMYTQGEAEERSIEIRKVRILPQPFGAVFNLMMNNHGRIVDKEVARQKFGVIDIGFRTTDYTITDRLRYIERGSRTTDTGISKAFSLISRKIQEQSGVNIELYRLFEPVKNGSIRIRGKEFGLAELRDEVMRQLSTAIINDMERLWVEDWDLEFILLSGGGAADLAPILENIIDGTTRVLNTDTDMRLTNVVGYLKYAKYIDLMEKRRQMPSPESVSESEEQEQAPAEAPVAGEDAESEEAEE